ncbi:hypothetical protein K8R42_02815 [bacterium]|nr:hypothetical protein [bacterium]
MKNILFDARNGYEKLFPLIAQKLDDNKYKCYYLTQNDNEKDFLILNFNIDEDNIFCRASYIRENDVNEIDIDNLKHLENVCKIPLWKVIYSDRFSEKYSYNDKLKYTYIHMKLFSEIYSEYNIDIFVSETISFLSSYMAYLVGKLYDVQYIGYENARIDNRIFITSRPHSSPNSLEENYLKWKSKSNLDSERKFLNDFKNNKTIPNYMSLAGGEMHTPLRNILGAIINLTVRRNVNKYDYITKYLAYEAIGNLKKEIIFALMYKQVEFCQPDYNEKYILFPLHFQPEATTLTFATYFLDQLQVIEALSKSIPINHVLYVKEHYAQLGSRKIDFYKKIKQYKNIKLIDPFIHSHELIQNSRIVVILTSTTGWETILYGKPLIVMGDIFYEYYKHANKVTDFTSLPTIIQKIINETYNEADILQFIGAYLESTYKGCFVPSDKSCFSCENIELLAKALLKEIEL